MAAPIRPIERVENRHRRAVAEAPDEPLGRGRHQLAVLAQQAAVRSEEQDRAIKRPTVAFDHADDEVSTKRPGPWRREPRWPAPARRPHSPSTGGTSRVPRVFESRRGRQNPGPAGIRKQTPRERRSTAHSPRPPSTRAWLTRSSVRSRSNATEAAWTTAARTLAIDPP